MNPCPSINPETGSKCMMAENHFGPHCTGSPYKHLQKEKWVTKCVDRECDYHESFVSHAGFEECIHCGHERPLQDPAQRAFALLERLASFEYKGGGYYRKKGVPKGKTAEMLHGSQIQELIEEFLEETEG